MTCVPGLILVSVLAAVAQMISHLTQVSATLMALLLGFVLGNLWLVRSSFKRGINWAECQALSVAVALLGAQLNLAMLAELSWFTMVLIVAGLLLTFVVTFVLAKWLRLGASQACLLASGQAICGSAAVMATQQVLKAPAAQAGMVVALVNFLGFVGVFVLPVLAQQFLSDDPTAAGQLMGNTLQSMGHVVAAGFTTDPQAGQVAVLTKMCRILFLIPVLLLILGIARGGAANTRHVGWLRLIPGFIWLFLLLCGLNSLQWLPPVVQTVSEVVSHALFLLAMVAIGLNIQLRLIWRHGGQLLLLGGLVFAIQVGFSLVLLSHS